MVMAPVGCLKIAFQTSKRLLCVRKIAGLQGAADGLEILSKLTQAIPVHGLVRVACRRQTGYAANRCRLLQSDFIAHFYRYVSYILFIGWN